MNIIDKDTKNFRNIDMEFSLYFVERKATLDLGCEKHYREWSLN